jgi:hypothetical protein
MKTGLELLREPFPEDQIGQLPKGTKKQNECPDNEKKNCKICGGWHHPNIIHLKFVGHAALTNRLLDADINWSWEPMAFDKDGLPAFDASGGLWIRLTVSGQTRIGYGNAAASQYKEVGSREKEVIGDALRNSALRFGAALSLWHKGGELYISEPETSEPAETTVMSEAERIKAVVEIWKGKIVALSENGTIESFKAFWPDTKAEIIHDCKDAGAAEVYKLFNETYKKLIGAV